METTRKENLMELLRPWAGMWTLHTRHALDDERFNEVIDDIYLEFGGDIPRAEFKAALTAVVSDTPETLDGPQSVSVIDRFSDKALGDLEYLGRQKKH